MNDIKTRELIKGTIKSIDRASIATDKMKSAYAKTKEMGSESYSSPSSYAESTVSDAARTSSALASDAGATLASKVTDRSIAAFRNDSIKNLKIKNSGFKGRSWKSASTAKSRKAGMSASRKSINKRQASLAKKRAVERIISGKNLARGRRTLMLTRRLVVAFLRAARAAIASMKALIAAIAGGGWAAVIIIIICVMFGGALYFFGDESNNSYIPVSAEVEAYTPTITKYANEYGIGEYVELIKAVMMQESGGRGKDPMQSSESGYNKKYPNEPNGITDPDYSIKCGVQALASCLKAAGVSTPLDMDKISLALQGYNFGNGYISWAKKKYGGYSQANAKEFAKQQAAKQGWSSYGDVNYVDHVLRYYPYGNFTYDVEYTGPGRLGLPIKGMSKAHITSYFGPRSSPGGIGSSDHKGIDIGYSTGTRVLACERGTVTTAGWNGGYGKCIIISHSGGITTLYGHLSSINVRRGQQVVRGQYIGKVGSTGNSTGPHLHLSVIVRGSYVNPLKGWLGLK